MGDYDQSGADRRLMHGTLERDKPRRLAQVALAMVLGAVLLIELFLGYEFIVVHPGAHGHISWTDFAPWFGAAQLLGEGRGAQLYDPATQLAAQRGVLAPDVQPGEPNLFHYWPILAGLFLPVTGWPIEVAYAVWVLLGAAAFTLALLILVRTLGFRREDGLLFALGAWTFLPHLLDLLQAQTSNLLCLPLALGLLALRRGVDGPAGVALGLLWLKPQLAVIWVVALLAGRRWRALLGLLGTGCAMLGLSTVLAGPGWIADWIHLSSQVMTMSSGYNLDPIYSQNFRLLLATSFGMTGAEVGQLVMDGVLALLVAWAWWQTPALSGARGRQLLGGTVLAMLLVTPVLGNHDLTFWMVAAAFLLAPGRAAAAQLPDWTWRLLCGVGWLIPVLAVLTPLSNPLKIPALYMVGAGILLLIAPVLARAPAPSWRAV